ncbi:cytochrome P450 2C23-like [Petaurus breviceps papuanus]|uniref:cytochrome P450 2C23-like n=1 Tax=Petaurus breviceps papuanus TaxID=3040969 RepID=UPI0036D8B7D3
MGTGSICKVSIKNVLKINVKSYLEGKSQLAEKYGSIFTVYLGTQRVVVLHGYDILKEALIDHPDAFVDRPIIPLIDDVVKGKGVIASRGERWKQLRRFSLMTLRNFGMGKRSIEERVQEEAQCLVEELRKTDGQPTDPTFIIGCAPCNVICSILFRDRFKYSDEKFLHLLKLLNENFRFFNSPWIQIYNSLPAFRVYLPGQHRRLVRNIEEIKHFILERVKEHQKILDPNNPQDYIDCYLSKMQQFCQIHLRVKDSAIVAEILEPCCWFRSPEEGFSYCMFTEILEEDLVYGFRSPETDLQTESELMRTLAMYLLASLNFVSSGTEIAEDLPQVQMKKRPLLGY